MKVTPTEKIKRIRHTDPAAEAKTHKLMRQIAIVIAFISTYFFIIKILFL